MHNTKLAVLGSCFTGGPVLIWFFSLTADNSNMELAATTACQTTLLIAMMIATVIIPMLYRTDSTLKDSITTNLNTVLLFIFTIIPYVTLYFMASTLETHNFLLVAARTAMLLLIFAATVAVMLNLAHKFSLAGLTAVSLQGISPMVIWLSQETLFAFS